MVLSFSLFLFATRYNSIGRGLLHFRFVVSSNNLIIRSLVSKCFLFFPKSLTQRAVWLLPSMLNRISTFLNRILSENFVLNKLFEMGSLIPKVFLFNLSLYFLPLKLLCHCDVFTFYCSYATRLIFFVQCIPRLDDVRGKKKFWRPMFEPKVFRSKCDKVLVTLIKYLWHCWDFSLSRDLCPLLRTWFNAFLCSNRRCV